MARRNRITISHVPASGSSVAQRASERERRHPRLPFAIAAHATALAIVLACAATPVAARSPTPEDDRERMRGLDEQIQEIKSEVLDIAQELTRLEEKLLYPSGTQAAIFIALADGDPMRLDAVRLTIDGELVAHHIYSFKELEALRKGGVQRIWVGNVATGEHRLEVTVDAKLDNGDDFRHTAPFVFRKEVEPERIGLTLSGPGAGDDPIVLGDW